MKYARHRETKTVYRYVCSCLSSQSMETDDDTQRLYVECFCQRKVVDFVGPLPMTTRRNKGILVLIDYSTKWQDALAFLEAMTLLADSALEMKVLGYLGLPQKTWLSGTDLGALTKGHWLRGTVYESVNDWAVPVLARGEDTHHPYHSQASRVVEQNNRQLSDSLRAPLLPWGQEECDTLLCQLLRTYRGALYSVTRETINLLMFGQELHLPN